MEVDNNEYDIEKLRESFNVTLEVRGYVLLRNGTIVKKDTDGKYRKVDTESDTFAKLMYDSAHKIDDFRVYRDDSPNTETEASENTDDFNR